MTHHDANPPAINPETPQRRAARADASVWVGASAGTGKTKVLTDRVLTLLLAGTPPEKILCLTFTKAAAAEMSNRLADKLAVWSTLSDSDLRATLEKLLGAAPSDDQVALARRLFARVLDVPGGMKIQTIHSFCQALLRRFPLEAGIAPHFEVMDDRDASEAMAEARDDVLARARSGTDPELTDALATITALVHEIKFPDLLQELSSQRGPHTPNARGAWWIRGGYCCPSPSVGYPHGRAAVGRAGSGLCRCRPGCRRTAPVLHSVGDGQHQGRGERRRPRSLFEHAGRPRSPDVVRHLQSYLSDHQGRAAKDPGDQEGSHRPASRRRYSLERGRTP